MTVLALLRHGPTAWSREHRLQGRTDLPLDAATKVDIASWRLPAELTGARWLTSPLRRARDTAKLLDLEAAVEPRLVEMNWGAWEGKSVGELRRLAAAFTAEEARGLDLTPPGGESPRMVQHRLMPLLARLADGGGMVGAVTHKGVIRALFALATGWAMLGKPPEKLAWDALHLFRLGRHGGLRVERLNLPVRPA